MVLVWTVVYFGRGKRHRAVLEWSRSKPQLVGDPLSNSGGDFGSGAWICGDVASLFTKGLVRYKLTSSGSHTHIQTIRTGLMQSMLMTLCWQVFAIIDERPTRFDWIRFGLLNAMTCAWVLWSGSAKVKHLISAAVTSQPYCPFLFARNPILICPKVIGTCRWGCLKCF